MGRARASAGPGVASPRQWRVNSPNGPWLNILMRLPGKQVDIQCGQFLNVSNMRAPSSFAPGHLLRIGAICLLMPLATRADTLDTNTPAIMAAAGSTGVFEEFITVPVDLTDATVTSFTLTLTATAVTGSGLSFTSVSMATTPDPYVFQGMSTDVADSAPFSSSTFPNLSFTASDSDTDGDGVPLTSGTDYGLVEVSYAVAADATPGTYMITPSGTVEGAGDFTDGFVPETLTIVPAGVPEPSTWALLGLCVACWALTLPRRAVRV
jgi:hypothetical protein